MSDSKKKVSEQPLPPCGLYRTTRAFPGHEEELPIGRLVSFHNHSDQDQPIVLLPASNAHNKWAFHQHGYLVDDPSYLDTLEPLLKEGFYMLRSHVHVGDKVIGEGTLVQLGYNPQAEPIIFVGERKENAIRFPDRGWRFEENEVLEKLEPTKFKLYSAADPKKEDDHSGPTLH